MKFTPMLGRWIPIVVGRIIDLVDEDMVRGVLVQAIERLQDAIKRSESQLDDRIILPLLEITLNILDAKEGEI